MFVGLHFLQYHSPVGSRSLPDLEGKTAGRLVEGGARPPDLKGNESLDVIGALRDRSRLALDSAELSQGSARLLKSALDRGDVQALMASHRSQQSCARPSVSSLKELPIGPKGAQELVAVVLVEAADFSRIACWIAHDANRKRGRPVRH